MGRETDGACAVSAASRARGEYLRTHFKNMREVAAALTGQCVCISGRFGLED